jgi:hypothetical protein
MPDHVEQLKEHEDEGCQEVVQREWLSRVKNRRSFHKDSLVGLGLAHSFKYEAQNPRSAYNDNKQHKHNGGIFK